MASHVGVEVPGTYDDQPEHPVHTVLAVPITLVPAVDCQPRSPVAVLSARARRHASVGRHRRSRSRPRAVQADPTWRGTVATGLGAAGTVFALVAALLLLVQLTLR